MGRRNELLTGTYRPTRNRKKEIPKGGGKVRTLGIPTIRDRVIELIDPILRGWVNYFRVGHSSRCFGYVKDWLGKKIRRHLMRARKLTGFGWDRWSSQWIYWNLGLFSDYRVRYNTETKALPVR